MRIKKSGVYKITNTVNEKIYIGSSKDMIHRWNVHAWQLRRGDHHCMPLQNAWNKYGEESFVHEIIEECECVKEVLLSKEQFYLDTLKPEYNINPTAGSRLGSKWSEKTRATHPANGNKWTVGIKRTPEQIEKNRQAKLGHKQSPETIAKRVEKNKGRRRTDEFRTQCSEWQRGNTKGQGNKGKALSPEHIEKMRQNKLGTTVSEETKSKTSASIKAWWDSRKKDRG